MITRWILICGALILASRFADPAAAQSGNAPPPEPESLVTKDGVQLRVTYFPATLRRGAPGAKQVTPVVLLHDRKETRGAFTALAQRLQSPAEGELDRPTFAAVTVDLRAHGDSTKQIFPDGSQVDLDAARLDKAGLLAMARFDMEAVRNFLVGKNDAGELNLNKLCLVGAGMGASVATNWTLQDWTAPPLAIGKQGQDVKAVVLISPRWSYNGLSLQEPMRFRPLKRNLAWLIMYGSQDAKVKADVQRINRQLERFHRATTGAGAQTPGDLLVLDWPSKLQGSTLLRQVGAPMEDQIINFLVVHVATTVQPWTSRRGPLP